MSDTTTIPTYVAVRNKGNFKITAKAVILKAHAGTNMLMETEEKVILDDVLYEGFYTQQLAEYAARKDIDTMIADGLKVKMEDVAVTARPF